MTGDILAHKLNSFTNLLSFNTENAFIALEKDLFQQERSDAAGGNEKWCTYFDKQTFS